MKYLDTNTAAELLNASGIKAEPVGNGIFSQFAPIGFSSDYDAVFMHERGGQPAFDARLNLLAQSPPSVLITTVAVWLHIGAVGKHINGAILVDDPRLAFSCLAPLLDAHEERKTENGYYYNAEKRYHYHHLSTIHDRAVINHRATIHPNTVIFGCATIGMGSEIGPGAVIGCNGLSMNRVGNGIVNTAHVGSVAIGSKVFIGANTVVQRAVLGKTEIGDFAHIAHNSVIGHAVKVGRCAGISSNVTISGSCSIGEHVWVGPNSCVREGVSIGDGAFIGIGSVVISDVESDAVVYGNPAKKSESKKPWTL